VVSHLLSAEGKLYVSLLRTPFLIDLQTPMHLPANSEIEVSMWRQTDDRKVWYEWLVESFMTISGQRIRLSISELHSSKSNGCMM
jgi:protein arginine N-methyltransferase 5